MKTKPSKMPLRGGNLTVRSDGTGPDDYLFRRGRQLWVRVTVRHGVGLYETYKEDLRALSALIKLRDAWEGRIHVAALQKIYGTRSNIVTMSASEYLAWFKNQEEEK